MREPTQFSDLNKLLTQFVAGVKDALATNLCGVYLVGSFALGDADEHSDVDFIVVPHLALGVAEEEALRTLHGCLYNEAMPWAQHLEGSYIHKAALRRPEPPRSQFLYLDNGATDLIRDAHDNTWIARWTLRERGITLFGPPPTRLVDRVNADDMRADSRNFMREACAWAKQMTPEEFSRWAQPYLVLAFCRFLHTSRTATVVSKRQAGEWAQRELDPRWNQLIKQALIDRPDPWSRVHQPADPRSIEETIAFIDYSLTQPEAHPPSSGRADLPH